MLAAIGPAASMAMAGTGTGTPLVMEPCDSSDARQLFNLG
jgi:hypothetical protein